MRRALPVLLALFTVTGAVAAQTVAQEAARGMCSTAGVTGLSQQLVETQQCLYPGDLVDVTPHAGVTLTASRLYPYLQSSARDALWSAARTVPLQINSMFRTLADQYVLYHSGACGLAATPGNSNHETGRAVDVANWSAALRTLESAGCTHTYPGTDDVHFDCPGADHRANSVRSFQHLWNTNHPSDLLAEDGAYGPLTGDRLGRSPAAGFATHGCTVDAGVPDAGAPDAGVHDAGAVDAGPHDAGSHDAVASVDAASAADVATSSRDGSVDGALADARVDASSEDVPSDAATITASDGSADGSFEAMPDGGCQCHGGRGARSSGGLAAMGIAGLVLALRWRRRRRQGR